MILIRANSRISRFNVWTADHTENREFRVQHIGTISNNDIDPCQFAQFAVKNQTQLKRYKAFVVPG
jgi:hypothetical protein